MISVITFSPNRRRKNKLYGYAIVENEVRVEEVSDNLCGLGAYVQVYGDSEKITINQDFMGSYGIYLYEDEEFFAISNSFMMLEEYLRDNHHKMTLNRDYVNYYLGSNSSSHLPWETMVNEIRVLPRNFEIILNKADNTIQLNEIDYKERTVSIKSEEGLEILDNWFYRWIEIFRNVRVRTNNLIADLTGGFDSRITLGICLAANMDLEHIKINSSTAERHKEDFQVASQIVDKFNLELNRYLYYGQEILDFEDHINLVEYIKGGFHKQHYVTKFKPEKYHYRITGHCGETLREYPHEAPDEFVRNAKVHAKNVDISLVASTESLLENSFNEIYENLGIEDSNSHRITTVFFNEGRNRIHFGKGFVGSYLFNRITLAPFTDP